MLDYGNDIGLYCYNFNVSDIMKTLAQIMTFILCDLLFRYISTFHVEWTFTCGWAAGILAMVFLRLIDNIIPSRK